MFSSFQCIVDTFWVCFDCKMANALLGGGATKIALVAGVITVLAVGAIVATIVILTGNEGTSENTCTVSSPHAELYLKQEEYIILASWTGVKYSGDCAVTYNVTTYENDYKISTTLTTDTNFSYNGAQPCTIIKITVSSSTLAEVSTEKENLGYAETVLEEEIETNIGAVSNLVIDNLHASWSNMKHCLYEIQVNDEAPQLLLTNSYSLEDYDLKACLQNNFIVTPVMKDRDSRGDSAILKFEIEIGEVQNFIVAQKPKEQNLLLTATWDLYPNCRYTLSYKETTECEIFTNDCPNTICSCDIKHFDDTLEACQSYEFILKVESPSGQKFSETNTFFNSSVTFQITNFTINYENFTNIATWDDMGPYCAYKFKVPSTGFESDVIYSNSYVIPNEAVINCTSIHYNISAMTMEGFEVATEEKYYMPDMDIAEIGFRLDEEDSLYTFWTDLGVTCKYSVKVNDEYVVEEKYLPEHEISLNSVQNCNTYDVSVNAHSAFKPGPPIQESYRKEPPQYFYAVSNITGVMDKVNERMTLFWDVNDKLKSCGMKYNIGCSVNGASEIQTVNDISNVPPYIAEQCTIDSSTKSFEITIGAYVDEASGRKFSNKLYCVFVTKYYPDGSVVLKSCEIIPHPA